jgi:hypothetical protein
MKTDKFIEEVEALFLRQFKKHIGFSGDFPSDEFIEDELIAKANNINKFYKSRKLNREIENKKNELNNLQFENL